MDKSENIIPFTIPFSDICKMWGAINEQIGIELWNGTILFATDVSFDEVWGIQGNFYSANPS